MKCPRCTTTVLAERERDGVTIDLCGECRGVWLDRGELEKLVGRAQREIESLELRRAARPLADRTYRTDDDDDDDDRRGGRPPRRRWFELLGDVFD